MTRRLLDDGWLCIVVDSEGLDELLDADPSVIAYCDHEPSTYGRLDALEAIRRGAR